MLKAMLEVMAQRLMEGETALRQQSNCYFPPFSAQLCDLRGPSYRNARRIQVTGRGAEVENV